MKAFVITIKGHDKSEKIANRCIKTGKANGLTIEKHYGITPKDNPRKIFENRGFTLKNFNEKFSKSENALAAFLSHLSLWEKSIEINDTVAIFEHDAVITDTIPITSNFTGCMTFSKPSYGNYQKPIFFGVGKLTQKPYFGGAHGYIVNPSGSKQLVEKAITSAGPADVYLNVNNFPWLQEFYPWVCEAKDSFSTIQREKGCLAKHNYNDQYEIVS